jgi:hypothetical protein
MSAPMTDTALLDSFRLARSGLAIRRAADEHSHAAYTRRSKHNGRARDRPRVKKKPREGPETAANERPPVRSKVAV